MNILAFDTSLNKTYIAVSKDDTFVSKIYESDEKNYHSAYLIIGIKNILEENNLTLQDIDLFAVNHGPGSFTGIRAGVTVAKTLAKELNKNVIGINSLDILHKAYENLEPDIVLDARREQFYFKKGDKIELIPYCEVSNSITKKAIITDSSGLIRLREYLKDDSAKIINYEDDNIDLSKALILLAKEKAQSVSNFSWNNLNPAYIQAPPIHKKVAKN